MTTTISREEFLLLRGYIHDTCGILVGDEKSYLVESRLKSLMNETDCKNFKEFYIHAKKNGGMGLRDKIVDAMTTNESLWFRDKHPFNSLQKTLLPEFLKNIKTGKKEKIRIWSAGCSTGQEPYSIAMTVMEFIRENHILHPSVVEIFATDISNSALFLAMNGKYDSFTISRGLPEEMKKKYFDADNDIYSIKADVKKFVEFNRFNLQDSFQSLGKFDIIFCRNVAIYFSQDFKKTLFSKYAASLNSGGTFFLGASESMLNYSSAFQTIKSDGAIYYKVKS